MTNVKNASKLLGLSLAMMMVISIPMAFAVITNATGVLVTAPAQPNVNSVNVSWTSASTDDEPTDGALTGHYVEISDNGFTNIIQSVFISAPTTSTSFNSLQPNTSYDVRVIANFVTAGNQTGVNGSGSTNPDITDPVVTGSVTNINDGGSTIKTLADQYTESCTATDNDVFFVDNCSVQSGSINTSVLGLQTVIYEATDPSSNTGTDTVSTTIVAGNPPVITLTGANPQTITKNSPYVELGATASDVEDGNLTGSIVIDSSAVNTGVVGSYIVTYDVTDSSGNTDHEERTVNIVLGNAPIISIIGNTSVTLAFGFPSYSDDGATCSDVEDGVIIVVTTGVSSVNTSLAGTYQITYTCTDSSGNVSTAFRSVTVSDAPKGSSCTGDCEAPTLGLNKFGVRVVDNGITIITDDYKVVKDAVPFFTPMELLHADVGELVIVQLKVYDNSGKDNVRHVELIVGAKEIGDKEGTARIEVDSGSINIVDPNFLFTDPATKKSIASAIWDSTNCKTSQPNAKDCVFVEFKFIPREPIKNYVLATDLWDSYRYNQATWFNHGIAFEGETMNPLDTYQAISDGYIVSITEDSYGSYTATDEFGNKYTLDNGSWTKQIVVENNPKTIAKQLQLSEQEELAQKHWNGKSILKETPTFMAGDLRIDEPRGHHEHSPQMKLAMAIATASSGMPN